MRSLSYGKYLISPAANPALALTRNSSGITLQPVNANLTADQYWKISDTYGYPLNEGRTLVSGIYYINNLQTRTFLIKNGTATIPTLQAGTQSALGNKMAWVLTFVGSGYYTIQSLFDPHYYLTADSSGVLLEKLPSGALPNKAKFSVISSSGNFNLKSASGVYLSASGASNTSVITATAGTVNRTKWRLCAKQDYVEFSSSAIEQIAFLNPLQTSSIACDNSATWSELSDLTITANNNPSAVTVSSSGQLVGTAQGGISTLSVRHIPSGKSGSVTVKCGWLEDGMYFFQNMHSNLFLQPDNDGDSHMEQHLFTPTEQQWYLLLQSNGTYGILSNGLALNVQTGMETTADTALVQRAFSSSDLCQQWRITPTASGGYKVQAASAIANNVDLVMAIGTGITVGTNVEQREYLDNTSYKDEWHIFNNKQLNAPVIQQVNEWCWATSAQMLSRTHFPTTTDTTLLQQERNETVYHIFGDITATADTYNWEEDPQDLKSHGGYPSETARAAAYYTGMVGGDVTYTSAYAPYSEETLIRFLNDGLPVIHSHGIFSGTYPASFDLDDALNLSRSITSKVAGHAMLIVGMRWDSDQNCMIYTVNDPGDGMTHYFTYAELVFTITTTTNQTTGTASTTINLWTASVVVKTDYSENILFPGHIIEDYNSLEEYGGTQ